MKNTEEKLIEIITEDVEKKEVSHDNYVGDLKTSDILMMAPLSSEDMQIGEYLFYEDYTPKDASRLMKINRERDELTQLLKEASDAYNSPLTAEYVKETLLSDMDSFLKRTHELNALEASIKESYKRKNYDPLDLERLNEIESEIKYYRDDIEYSEKMLHDSATPSIIISEIEGDIKHSKDKIKALNDEIREIESRYKDDRDIGKIR